MSFRRCIYLFVVIFSQVVFSQKKNDAGSDPSIIVPNREMVSIVSNVKETGHDNGMMKSRELSTGSGILIEQVGDFNFVYANVNAKTVNIQVIQEGDNNFYELFKKSGNKIEAKAEQKGQNNFALHNSLYGANDMYLETMQKGDNLTIQSIGSNSISSNMKITQTGTGASVIVINN